MKDKGMKNWENDRLREWRIQGMEAWMMKKWENEELREWRLTGIKDYGHDGLNE